VRLCAFALLALAGIASADDAPSFKRDIVPVLRTRCATCHLTGNEAGNMALYPDAAYANLVGVKSPTTGLVRVDPGKPESSYLIMKLDGTQLNKGGAGARMPFGADPLPAETIALIASWIKAGAADN